MKKRAKVLALSDIQKLYKRKYLKHLIVHLLLIGILLGLLLRDTVVFITPPAIVISILFLPFLVVWIFFFFNDRENRRKFKNREFKILETRLQRKYVTDSLQDSVEVYIFEAKDKYGHICYSDVDGTIFGKRKVNDSCYLLLVEDTKEGDYKCIRVYWKTNTTLSEDLRDYLVTAEDIASG